MRIFKEIEVGRYGTMLVELSQSNDLDLSNNGLLIYGGGGQDRRFYEELSANGDFEVLWTDWAGPKWTKFLSFIPGQAGLVRIKNQARFGELFYELFSYSVSEALYAPKKLTEAIIQETPSKTWGTNFEKFISSTDASFLIILETDETITRKGLNFYLYSYHFGHNLNESIRSIIERELII